ncbi:hypothetical protein [Kistimonas asteriae]|uniref:hypothetical protein n=1 Tax=Kistimonas asteriae TaxID=517724 RepID=UPI001BABD1E4|nr:hypothetical protein [Kistimonas asteriae]
MGTKLLSQNRLANYARQALSKFTKTDKAKSGKQNTRTITIIDAKKQIPTETTHNKKTPISDHTSIHVTTPSPESGTIPTPENFKGDIKDHEEIVNSRKTEKDSIDITIDRLSKKSEWKLMNKTLTKRGGATSKKGFKKIIESMKNMSFADKRDIQRMALFAADKYEKKQFNEEQMAEYMDVFMQRFDHEKTQLQLTSARTVIHQSNTDPLAIALELIATIHERIENKFAEYSNHIKREVPVDLFGWKEINYKMHANQIDHALIKAIKLEIKNLPKTNINIGTTLITTEKIVNSSVKSHMANTAFSVWIKEMQKEGKSFEEIKTKTIKKFEKRYDSMTKTLLNLDFKSTEKALNDNRTLFIENITREVHETLIEKHGMKPSSKDILNHAPATERKQFAPDMTEAVSLEKAEKQNVMDDATVSATASHRSSVDDTFLETHLPRSILKELATESSTTAEEWRASGKLNKLEPEKTELADKAEETNKTTKGEEQSTESLPQNTTPPIKEKPAPNKKPTGLTLKGSTKQQVTTNTETLKDEPAYKKKPELPKKPDKHILNSIAKTNEPSQTIAQKVKPALKPKPKFIKQPDELTSTSTAKAQETKKPENQQGKPALKPKPVLPKKQDESENQSTIKTQETQKSETRSAKPPLPKKPAKLTQAQHQKPATSTTPLKEKQVESDVKEHSGNDSQPHKPGTVQQDKNDQNTIPPTVTADFIVAKITGQIEGEEYKLQAEVMSDVLKLAGQPDQLRKLLEQLDQAMTAGIDIKVIRGKEQFFKDELITLIDNQKANALKSNHRTGIQVKH